MKTIILYIIKNAAYFSIALLSAFLFVGYHNFLGLTTDEKFVSVFALFIFSGLKRIDND